MVEDDARQVIESVGLQMKVIGQANHPTIPAFAIIEQDIRAGEPVAEGDTIGVVISQGPELVELPSWVGKSLPEAEAQSQDMQLIVETRKTWSDQAPATVLAQDPPAGSLVQARSLVVLTVSGGTRVPVGAKLGDGILLVDYELSRLDYRSGDALSVVLTWRAVRPPAQGYTVFVHLTRSDGGLVAQHDALPSNGLRPTDSWSVDETIVDSHQLTIPSQTSAGEYWLRVGMYDDSGRLPVTDSGQAEIVDNALLLHSIQVE
jgi:hypothetical protein